MCRHRIAYRRVRFFVSKTNKFHERKTETIVSIRATLLLARESERRNRVLLQDEVVNLGFEACFTKVLDPAVGLDQWEVRSEQHFALELSIRVLHQLRRKIFRRPAG